MALGEDEAVAVRPIGLFGAQIQKMKIERGQYIRRRGRATDMARTGGMKGAPYIAPYLERFIVEPLQHGF